MGAHAAEPRRLAIYGAGAGGQHLWAALACEPGVHLVAFIDSDPRKAGTTVMGLEVRSPDHLALIECDAFVVASIHREPIEARLREAGVAPARIVSESTPREVLARLGLGGRHAEIPARPALHVAIFGAGMGGIRVWDQLAGRADVHVAMFLDNDPRRTGTTLLGVPVLSAATFDPGAVDLVVVGSMDATAIVGQLLRRGLPGHRICTVDRLAIDDTPASMPPSATRRPGPRILNYQVNDICNSRCVMCNIWTNTRDVELSPPQFRQLLQDPFFADVEHVGITGGEPTLRSDLIEFYLAAADGCPRLTGGSFITHGMDTERALRTYPRVSMAYAARRLHFSGFVSLDGIGEVHDRVRGRVRAFERSTRTLFGLREAGVAAAACCTVVKSNVWGLHDLLDWSIGKTYMRFRMGEFIRRLYNADATGEIRAFDDAERSHLLSFFQRLHDEYETAPEVRRTYASIMAMLAGGTRVVGCPYQSGTAISVDCRGRVAVCAPRGTPVPFGDAPAAAIAAAEAERRLIATQHCGDCMHDYHDEWAPEVADRLTTAAAVRRRLEADPAGEGAVVPPLPSRGSRLAVTSPKVLVLGWYGTETIGDLAILAGLMARHRAERPGTTFVVPSRHPEYTSHNLRRMGLQADVTSYGDPALLGDLWACDTVIIGGGPLMDIPELAHLASVFERARALRRRTIVDGCGIGPAHWPETRRRVRRILRAADHVRLRDAASAQLAATLVETVAAEVVADPAVDWVRSTGITWRGRADGPICVFARALTSEYPQATSPAAATQAVAAFLRSLRQACPEREVRLQAMHHFPVGGDDRLHARKLRELVGDDGVHVDEVPRMPLETLEIMAGAAFVVTMRFHALVFAHTLGAPLLAIDYTAGGKIASFLEAAGRADLATTLEALPSLSMAEIQGLPTWRTGLHT